MDSEKIAVVVETSLNEVIGSLSTVVFFAGCNLNCVYCYNHELVHPEKVVDKSTWKTLDELRTYIQRDLFRFKDTSSGKRVPISDWIVFSGGETLFKYYDEVRSLNVLARSLGFKTKLFTNGISTNRLKECVKDFDEISLDIKCCYFTHSDDETFILGKSLDYTTLIKRALAIISESGVPFEVRTVVFKPYIDQSQLTNISRLLNGHSPQRWILTPIKFPSTGLNGHLDNTNEVMAMDIKEMMRGIDYTSPIIISD